MFTVGLLCYGDHRSLAERCLGSIVQSADWSLIQDVRVAANAASPELRRYLRYTLARLPVPSYLVTSETNAGKYPLMRVMFASARLPLAADYFMWFDDDSYLEDLSESWWKEAARLAATADVVGRLHSIELRPRQHLGINAQPWCRRPLPARHRVKFATGGWWMARSAFLWRWDYPFPEIYHNGGDSILGALCEQQGARLFNWHTGVVVNADEAGTVNGGPRRGISGKFPWPWQDPAQKPPYPHQALSVSVEQLSSSLHSTAT